MPVKVALEAADNLSDASPSDFEQEAPDPREDAGPDLGSLLDIALSTAQLVHEVWHLEIKILIVPFRTSDFFNFRIRNVRIGREQSSYG